VFEAEIPPDLTSFYKLLHNSELDPFKRNGVDQKRVFWPDGDIERKFPHKKNPIRSGLREIWRFIAMFV